MKHRKLIIVLMLLALLFAASYLLDKEISPSQALVNFKSITEEDPLFVSPEMSGTALEESLSSFVGEQDKLLAVLGLDKEITPTGFLRAVIEVKKRHDFFMQEPDLARGEDLVVSYEDAVQIYENELEIIRTKLSNNFPPTQEQYFLNIGSSTTNNIMFEDFNIMKKNSIAIREEIERRKDILYGRKKYRSPVVKTSRLDELVSPSKATNTDKFVEGQDGLFDDDVFLISTDCFQPSGTTLPFGYYLIKNSKGVEFLLPKILSDNYYQKVNKGVVSEQKLVEKGIEWRVAREGNSYRCNNLEYQPTLLAMRYFLNRYRERPIFTDKLLSQNASNFEKDDMRLFEMGKRIEGRFMSENQHEEQDFIDLAKLYQYFYRDRSELDEKVRLDLRNRYLLIQNQQADLDLIINSLFSFDNILIRSVSGSNVKSPETVKYLYAVRNNYSLAFLNHSRAVWRIKEAPRYLTESQDKGAYANLKKVQEKYSSEEIRIFDNVSEFDILMEY